MSKLDIKINYLYHSGFAVETTNYVMIFDYFKDSPIQKLKNIANGAVGEGDLKTDKKILVFSSHSHSDHFNPVILDWENLRPDIKFIFSSDIKVEKKSKNIDLLSAYEEITIDDAYIKAYGSTDIGISFLVNVDGVSIFHAGDLNWWYWWDDTEEEIEKAENWFKEEVEKIKGEKIDIAFFPVDQRLEHNYCIGAKYFIQEINPSVLIPMHFGDKFETTERFSDEMKGASTKIIQLTHRGQEILPI